MLRDTDGLRPFVYQKDAKLILANHPLKSESGRHHQTGYQRPIIDHPARFIRSKDNPHPWVRITKSDQFKMRIPSLVRIGWRHIPCLHGLEGHRFMKIGRRTHLAIHGPRFRCQCFALRGRIRQQCQRQRRG
ncbi:MAG: hypothetical protein EDM03_08645 [Porphyrobacter sp. IPPAS B-1204]|nr:MAG: hypothetical protein EDM03_08645 [Porphyrobacter sp. IPPAS B-1204]